MNKALAFIILFSFTLTAMDSDSKEAQTKKNASQIQQEDQSWIREQYPWLRYFEEPPFTFVTIPFFFLYLVVRYATVGLGSEGDSTTGKQENDTASVAYAYA